MGREAIVRDVKIVAMVRVAWQIGEIAGRSGVRRVARVTNPVRVLPAPRQLDRVRLVVIAVPGVKAVVATFAVVRGVKAATAAVAIEGSAFSRAARVVTVVAAHSRNADRMTVLTTA